MKNSFVAFFGGIGAAVLLAFAVHASRRGRRWMGSYREMTQVDLNSAARTALLALGLDDMLADRVIENRPYRNKFDLVSRMVVPPAVFADLRRRVKVVSGGETTRVA